MAAGNASRTNEEAHMARLTVEKRRELQRLSGNFSEDVTARMRNAARRELLEDDRAILAELDELAAGVRLDAATATDTLNDADATWEVHLQRVAMAVEGMALYLLGLHDVLHDGFEEPYQEPEEEVTEPELARLDV